MFAAKQSKHIYHKIYVFYRKRTTSNEILFHVMRGMCRMQFIGPHNQEKPHIKRPRAIVYATRVEQNIYIYITKMKISGLIPTLFFIIIVPIPYLHS